MGRKRHTAGDFFLQFFPIRGKAEISINKTAILLTGNATATVSSNSGYAAHYQPDYEFFILRIDPQALTRTLVAITGATIKEPLRMHPQKYLNRPAAQILRQYIFLLADTLGRVNPPFSDWWVSQTEQLVMTLFLFGNQYNYSYLLETEPADSALRQVMRAEEYIAANLHQAITLEEIAAISGVSAFSLFRSFKKCRSYSPLEFASRLRLT